MEVVKIKNPDFSYWAWSTPWGHVLSLKTFCRNPVLSWAIRYSVFQPVKFVTSLSSCAALCFQLFDIWWSSLDKMNDFKAISRMAFFRFGEINRSLFWVFSKKNFQFFLVDYYISKYIKNKTGKKKNFEKTQNNDMFISPKRKNTILEMALKSFILSKLDHQMSKSWKGSAAHELKLVTNLTGWKTEYLIAQLRTGFRQKVYSIKTCPHGVLQAQ